MPTARLGKGEKGTERVRKGGGKRENKKIEGVKCGRKMRKRERKKRDSGREKGRKERDSGR